ncbi:MAG: hypothetical protein AB1510_13335 [Bacillota bacterium]
MREKSRRHLIVVVVFAALAAGWLAGCERSEQTVPPEGPGIYHKKKLRAEPDARLRNEITAAAEKADAVEVYYLLAQGNGCSPVPRARYPKNSREFKWLLAELKRAKDEGIVVYTDGAREKIKTPTVWQIAIRAQDRQLLTLNYGGVDGRIEKAGEDGVLFLSPKAREFIEGLCDISQRQYKYVVRKIKIDGHEYPVLHSREVTFLVKAAIPEVPSRVPPLFLEEEPVSQGSIYPGGEIPDTAVKFGKEEAVEKAKEYLAAQGVAVEKTAIVKVQPMVETALDPTGKGKERSRVLLYRVEFRRVVNGLLLANGDRIVVELDSAGVRSCQNWRRTITETGKPREIVSVEKAFREIDANFYRAYQACGLEEITEISLAYWIPRLRPQKVVHPAWAFKIGKEDCWVYIDAYTGKILLD